MTFFTTLLIEKSEKALFVEPYEGQLFFEWSSTLLDLSLHLFEWFVTLSWSETPLKEWNNHHPLGRAIWGTARNVKSGVFHSFTFRYRNDTIGIPWLFLNLSKEAQSSCLTWFWLIWRIRLIHVFWYWKPNLPTQRTCYKKPINQCSANAMLTFFVYVIRKNLSVSRCFIAQLVEICQECQWSCVTNPNEDHFLSSHVWLFHLYYD